MSNDVGKPSRIEATQPQGRRLSRMAAISPLLSLLCIAIIAALVLFSPRNESRVVETINGLAFQLAIAAAILGFVLALISIAAIRHNRQSLWGMPFAILGVMAPVVIALVFVMFVVWAFHSQFRGENLYGVANSLLVYGTDNSGKYPDPNKWCDLLTANADLSPSSLKHRGQGCYAFNDQVTVSSPNDVVLVFESEPGWNQHGGKELLKLDWYWPRGAFVMHKDFSVEYVWPSKIDNLRWSGEPNSKP